MRYRVYSAPQGSETPSPIEKQSLLFKEFSTMDDALAWARHVNNSGRVAISIDGDDGTVMDRRQIATTLHHAEAS